MQRWRRCPQSRDLCRSGASAGSLHLSGLSYFHQNKTLVYSSLSQRFFTIAHLRGTFRHFSPNHLPNKTDTFYVYCVYCMYICVVYVNRACSLPPQPMFASLVKAGSRYLCPQGEGTVWRILFSPSVWGENEGPVVSDIFRILPSLPLPKTPSNLLELNTLFSQRQLFVENASSRTFSAKPVRSSTITTGHHVELPEPLADFPASS